MPPLTRWWKAPLCCYENLVLGEDFHADFSHFGGRSFLQNSFPWVVERLLLTLLESAANLVLVPVVNLSAVLQHLECFARANAVLAHCSEIELVIPRYMLLFFYPWEAWFRAVDLSLGSAKFNSPVESPKCEGGFFVSRHVSQRDWLERELNLWGYGSWTQNSTEGPKGGPRANGAASLKKWGPNLPRPKSNEQLQ